MDKQFSKRLKEKRLEKNLIINDVARAIGVSQQAYIEYEKGNVYPKIDILVNICEILDVSLNYLVYGNDNAINIDSDIKKTMEVLCGLLIFKKIDYDKDNKFIKVFDDELNTYLRAIMYLKEEKGLDNIDSLRILLLGLNRLK
jgi:transcriptional regulator with XRE-family HTH domain